MDESLILRMAPFPLEEWVQHHHGSQHDTEEERSELGQGAFATTFRMTTRAGQLPVAVKRYVRRSLRALGLQEEDVLREAARLSTLQHPHIIRGTWAWCGPRGTCSSPWSSRRAARSPASCRAGSPRGRRCGWRRSSPGRWRTCTTWG